MIDILSLNYIELTEYMKEKGEASYRAEQLFSWLHEKRVSSFSDMSNLSKSLIAKLEEETYIERITIVKRLESSDGTLKYLFELSDGNLIEAVALNYHHGVTVCISSEVGCARNCSFCASAIGGLVRNLKVSEMLLEVYEIAKNLDKRIANVVLMGIGEPFDNFCNVMAFCDIICHEKGMNLSARAITISTCGVLDGIEKLREGRYKYTLSVSLHSAIDKTRSSLMPINDIYNLKSLKDSCRRYFEETKRRITFEYAVIKGVNDSFEDAKALSGFLSGLSAHVNLIPVNSVSEREYEADKNSVETFRKYLETFGINVTVRRTLGQDVNASCGQLRRNTLENMKE